MNYAKIQKLKDRLYFTPDDVADILKIKPASSRVLCSRYVRYGIFVRPKRNFYTLSSVWENAAADYFLKLANLLQVPSYISFMTALSLYGVTTQAQRNFLESASLKRTRKFSLKGISFNFYKLKKTLYFDFIKKDDIFMATKEKAFCDAVYLYSFGKYRMDFSSLDLSKLDKARIKTLARAFPAKTRKVIKRLCRI